jgi:K+-sensing histidine kinase KdpD
MEIGEGVRVPWPDSLCSRALTDGAALVPDVSASHSEVGVARELGIESYVGGPGPHRGRRAVRHALRGQRHAALARSRLLDMLELYAELLGERLSREGQRTAEDERRRARRAEQNERALFLREAEYRIREPLTVLQGWADALHSRPTVLDDEQRAAGLQEVVGERRAGQPPPRPAHGRGAGGDPAAVAGRAGAALRVYLPELIASAPQSRSHQLQLQPGRLPEVLADRVAMDKVLVDLLQAMAGWTPSGAPVVMSSQSVGSGVELTLSAPSASMPADVDVAALFAPLPAVAPGSARGAGTTYVARTLLEGMGGTLAVRRRRGVGLAVVLWLRGSAA